MHFPVSLSPHFSKTWWPFHIPSTPLIRVVQGLPVFNVNAQEAGQLGSVIPLTGRFFASCTESMFRKPPATFSGSSFHNLGYCKGFESSLSPWLPMTLCCSYGRTVSGARRLILLYDFLSQGKGGETAHFLFGLCRPLWARWCANGTDPDLICFFVFVSEYRKPLPLLKVQHWGFIKAGFVVLMSAAVHPDWQLATMTGVYPY